MGGREEKKDAETRGWGDTKKEGLASTLASIILGYSCFVIGHCIPYFPLPLKQVSRLNIHIRVHERSSKLFGIKVHHADALGMKLGEDLISPDQEIRRCRGLK